MAKIKHTNASSSSSALLQHQELQQPSYPAEVQDSAPLSRQNTPAFSKENQGINEKSRSKLRRATTAHLSLIAVIVSTLIPFIALITWIARRRVDGSSPSTIFDTFAGEKVGGSLTQPQAKAIDVVAGAVFAPLVAAGFDFILFSSARVSVVSEKRAQHIPLRSLVTASISRSGSYNLFDFRNLIQSRSWKLSLLASITLLAALTRTAFTNIIAYEAYEVEDAVSHSTVRLQTDIAPWWNISAGYGGLALLAPEEEDLLVGYDLDLSTLEEVNSKKFTLTPDQQTELTNKLMMMLTRLPSQDMSVKLINSMYVAGNVTQKSLDALPSSVVKLGNVPAYRLSIDCRVDLPIDIGLYSNLNERFTTSIQVHWPAPGGEIYQLTSRYPGPMSQVGYDPYTWVFTAFGGQGKSSTEVYLGAMTPYNLTNLTGPSTSYGDVRYGAFDMTTKAFAIPDDPKLFASYPRIMSVFGLKCSIFHEDGRLNYTRVAINDSISHWDTSSFITLNPPPAKVRVPLFLGAYQGYKLNYHRPGSYNPGLAPAFLPLNSSHYPGKNATVPESETKLSLDEYAMRFLYASGEAQSILYEVTALNTSASHNPPQFFVQVPSVSKVLRYRITLVPSLLLLGLVAMVVAAAITAALMAYTWKTTSTRSFRRVDEVRVLVDTALLLREDKDDLLRLARCSNDDVNRWAAKNRVKYVKMDEGDGGGDVIVLKKA